MNISKISAYAAPSFSAQTRISAPENLLSKDDINRFVEMGKKYKTPQDIIEINISDIHPSENNPNVQVYTCTKIMKGKSPKGEYCDKSQIKIRYINLR